MFFKNFLRLLFLPLIILLSASGVLATLTNQDEAVIRSRVQTIAESVNSAKPDSIQPLISPTARLDLYPEIKDATQNGGIVFTQTIDSIKEISPGTAIVKGVFSASGPGWSIDKLSNEFYFTKINNQWLLSDTDFHTKIGSSYVWEAMKPYLLIIIPAIIIIALATSIFWFLMLVDCRKRDFKDRSMWILLLVIAGFTGACVYYFVVKRANKKQEGGGVMT